MSAERPHPPRKPWQRLTKSHRPSYSLSHTQRPSESEILTKQYPAGLTTLGVPTTPNMRHRMLLCTFT